MWSLCCRVFAWLQSQFPWEHLVHWMKYLVLIFKREIRNWRLKSGIGFLALQPNRLSPSLRPSVSHSSHCRPVVLSRLPCRCLLPPYNPNHVCFSNCQGDKHDQVKLKEIIFSPNSVWGFLLLFWPCTWETSNTFTNIWVDFIEAFATLLACLGFCPMQIQKS